MINNILENIHYNTFIVMICLIMILALSFITYMISSIKIKRIERKTNET